MADRAAYEERMRSRIGGFDAFSRASVGIAGLGGLGSQTAMMLARTGVGRLTLVDFDEVDISNLNRQNYTLSDVGRPKTEATAEHIREVNPFIEVRTANVRLVQSNQADVFRDCGIIVEALDGASEKVMLISQISSAYPDRWIVGGNGLAGPGPSNLIRTERAADRLVFCGDGSSEIGPGVSLTAPRVVMTAAHQANAVLRILLGLDPVGGNTGDRCPP